MRLVFLLTFFFLLACSGKNSAQMISAVDLHKIIANDLTAQVVDVRTVEEFNRGHLPKAVNLNVKDSEQLSRIDKSRPVYVYCQVGGRSAAAAEFLKEKGYNVFDLEKGILGWRAAEFAEVKPEGKIKGMTLEEYQALLQTDKPVLIDFYAKWCGPCVKMKPFLEELSKEYEGKAKIERIDVDVHSELAKHLKVSSLPKLILYKGGKEMWSHNAFMTKEQLKEVLDTRAK